ncbi:unnamed protein product [Darwinula stevensoni]|uniref:GB1/RHD3-type G domain-containing protein n=1 Tax=Darwinula stevensoni TaxID=69355 RepID=A0A7R8X6D7_9CRUS|nr:unnamed protein product [Darwinula stevensoni]CAG0885791.1 unnamed protein product [Darwinula stevensoni]
MQLRLDNCASQQDMDEDAGCEKAICVVEHKEFEGGKDSYLLKEDRLRRLLLQADCRDKPVAVLSIAGGARRGKSFLLSLFLRYLRAQGSEDWLDDEDIPVTGFAWKMSAKRVTTGIHIWDDIFTLRLPNGQEACVLLMDTEGTFDCEESLAHSVTVFALSTLLSSLQIYNLKDNINMDDLHHLQVVLSTCEIIGFLNPQDTRNKFFTGYGRLCLEASDDKPFQNFLFLVRDWRNHHEFPYGSVGGQAFLKEKLQTSGRQREEVKKVKEGIKECFEKLNGFLMPYPGEKVAGDLHFSGSLSDIQLDFKYQLRFLVPKLLSPENLVLKTIAGRPITCKQIFEYFKCYIGVFNNRAEILKPKNIFEATAEVQHRNSLDEAVDHYAQHMDRLLVEVPFLTKKKLNEVHASLRMEAIGRFASSKKMGDKELSGKYELLLDKDIHRLHKNYEMKRNAREERTKTELMDAATSALREYIEEMADVMLTVPLPTAEELRVEHEEKRSWAIQIFLEHRGSADEELFRRYEEKLKKDVESEATLYFKERQRKESIADRELINNFHSTVWFYNNQLGHSLTAAAISEEELESEHRKHYKEAIDGFLRRAQNTICPYLLDGHLYNLMRRLDEQYKKYIELKESKERQAETELMKAKEKAMEIYNEQMSKLLVELMSEEKLNDMHAHYRRETMESFEETGKKYPKLAKKHADEMESCLSSEHERYKAFRNAQELQAAAVLNDAVKKSVIHYEVEMTCLRDGKGINDGGRQGATDSHILTEEELFEGHEKYREEALGIFWTTGVQWLHLAEKYKEELEKVGNSRLKNEAVLPDPASIRMPLGGRPMSPSLDEGVESEERKMSTRQRLGRGDECRESFGFWLVDADWNGAFFYHRYAVNGKAFLRIQKESPGRETLKKIWLPGMNAGRVHANNPETIGASKDHTRKEIRRIHPGRNVGRGMDMEEARGSPICVVEHNEHEGRGSYLLKEDRLHRLLMQEHCKDKPVAVVSIAGEARRGKSFLLSLFLRYLRAQGSEEWLDDENIAIEGFAWKMSSRRVTTGIHIWDEIFTLKLPNGEEREARKDPGFGGVMEAHLTGNQQERVQFSAVPWLSFILSSNLSSLPAILMTDIPRYKLASTYRYLNSIFQACILLMDTEGTFDCEESLAHSVTVFALSTLLSSVHIYNLKDNIHMDDLLNLQFFTGYGRLCLQESNDEPFQNFLFLVRDWRNFDEFPYGSEGGQAFLDEKLLTSETQREEVRKVKEDIKHCFTKLNCFLMPHPGEKVAGDPRFSGSLSDIQKDFKDQLRQLVPQLLSPENLVLKTIAGKPITCKELFEYFRCYVGVYNNREKIPEPKSIFEVIPSYPIGYLSNASISLSEQLSPSQATAEIQNRNARDEAVDHYTQKMNQILAETPVPTQKSLDEVHASLQKEAIDRFTNSKKMGGKERSERYVFLLEKNLHELHEIHKIQRNAREERTRTELMEAANKTLEEYREDMSTVMRIVPLVTEETLRGEHEEKKTRAMLNFRGKEEIANEDLFKQYQEKLAKDIHSQSTLHFTERQWREKTADQELLHAVQSAVTVYSAQLGRSCGEAVITEEKLESEHGKYYMEAIEAFSRGTQTTLCPYLLDGHKDNLTKMSKLLVALMSEEKLNGMHSTYHRQAIEFFDETGKKYPYLVKKHKDDLEAFLSNDSIPFHSSFEKKNPLPTPFQLQRISSEHERYKEFRNSQELQAEAALHDAVERSVTHYELKMSCLCGGKDTADGGRQVKRLEGRPGPTDSHLTEKELLEGHEKYRREALKIFWEIGAQWLHLAEIYKEELEECLARRKDELKKKEKANEKCVRRLLEKSVRAKAEDYLSPSRMKKFYGETVVDERELKENHVEHRDAVVRSFLERGDWAAAKLLQEYRSILESTLNDWHRSLETKMAEERAKRQQDATAIDILGTAGAMAVASLGPAGPVAAGAVMGAARGIAKCYTGGSRWQNKAVLPDPSSIRMPLRGQEKSSPKEGEDSEEQVSE